MSDGLPSISPNAIACSNKAPPSSSPARMRASKANLMSAAWSMPVDFSPPEVAAVIDRNTHTRQLVDASGEFTLAPVMNL
ncbi:hypothetical protein [Noviherbaspirillum pedocola]|uniref:Uncharacterized protein n=1 Tax=Noviherbaspirillum pedocola TaxID=2801341 RepID=A0A934SYX4_9BURK|nr:hypothetical protein [Noviherbaspirillum pedocola]MBK4739095.1 hypothetical protein [Noviherbaspirillum pedocola]